MAAVLPNIGGNGFQSDTNVKPYYAFGAIQFTEKCRLNFFGRSRGGGDLDPT